MSSAILKTLSFFFFSSIALCKTQAGIIYQNENTYRSTAGPLLVSDIPVSNHINGLLGAGLSFSSQDFEAIAYSSQIVFLPTSWSHFSVRLSHRMNLPETFSRTSFLVAAGFESSFISSLRFFGTFGWYKRAVHLSKAQVIPAFTNISFSEHDFATEIGFSASLSPVLDWTVKVATFDEVDTFNLNNPFVESTFLFSPKQDTHRWLATIRYQLLLGFGRLDRLTFLAGYQWDT